MSWENCMMCVAALGPPDDVHCLHIFSQDAMGLAVTGHVCRLSVESGQGVKFVIGRKWQDSIGQNAKLIQNEINNL